MVATKIVLFFPKELFRKREKKIQIVISSTTSTRIFCFYSQKRYMDILLHIFKYKII